ncbi:MAG: DUF1254 domain-containing protein [Pseudomonadota bacterium]
MNKTVLSFVLATLCAAGHAARTTTPVPPAIVIPDMVDTRIGTLRFHDGVPDQASVTKLYDNLDFLRGVDAYLNAIPGASMVALRRGLRSIGAEKGAIAVFDDLMDARSLVLTGNSESVYAMTWLDLKDGPLVVESPPNTLGVVDDFWFRYVADLGNAGPDKGKGGKFLFLPPGYQGAVPEGYHVFRSPTFGNLLIWRAFTVNGDPKPGAANVRQHARVYPLAQAANPLAPSFVNASGKVFNTIHANDYSYYEELNELIQEEPSAALDAERLGQLAGLGMVKGKPFAPDARLRKILAEAAVVGAATARAQSYATRDREAYFYPGSQWRTPFIGNSYSFTKDGATLLDARSMFFYMAVVTTPAMTVKRPGVGSQYAFSANDQQGRPLDGGCNYRITLPPNPPAKNFWSLVAYDTTTRSMLQTDQPFPSVNTSTPGVVKNADGATDVYFGPQPPAGKAGNWVQTLPGKGWSVLLRLYGPLEPWFDKSWQPGDIVLLPSANCR